MATGAKKDQVAGIQLPAGVTPGMMLAIAAMMSQGGEPDLGISHKTVEGEGENIVLPRGMSKKEGSEELMRQWEEEETKVDMTHIFDKWDFNDALVAVMRQTQEQFGWINAQARHSFFGTQLPDEIQLPVGIVDGVVQTETGFMGDFRVSSWDGAKGTVGRNNAGKVVLTFAVKKKFRDRVKTLFQAIEQRLSTKSIYKGKSVVYEDGGFSFFENKGDKNIVLNKKEELVIKNLVLAPLGRRGKRTILFTGPYGTGKTETAMRVGLEANMKDITFIYCKKATEFAKLLALSVQYQPAVLFLEDIDEQGSGEERNEQMNNLLNTLDGVQTKGNNITTIFTTNHENRINKAMRRPGRIDLIARFEKCEPDTVQAIYERRFQTLPGGPELDYAALAAETPLVQGAVVAEIVQRTIDTAEMINKGFITDEIVRTAISSMEAQIAFMEADPEDGKDKLRQALDTVFGPLRERLADAYEHDDWSDIAQALRD